MKRYDFYWTKLDNIAAFFAAISTSKYPNVNRISVKLKDKVDVEILKKALMKTLIAAPTFNVKLRRGVFWYYLETNPDEPIICNDASFVLTTINNFDNNYFLFKVSFYNKRINLDASHILSDGTGLVYFFEALVSNYLKEKYQEKVDASVMSKCEFISRDEMDVDSFLKHYKMKLDTKYKRKEPTIKAYSIEGKKINRSKTKIIEGTMSVSKLKVMANQKGISITVYLMSILIYAIFKENYKKSKHKRPIAICVPVNLRNYFDSKSMKNFFVTLQIRVDFRIKEYTLDEVYVIVNEQLQSELNQTSLLNKFKASVELHQSIGLKIIPLFIKEILAKYIGGMLSKNETTMVLSNLGQINLGESLVKFIDKFDVIAYTDKPAPIKSTICSFGDNLTITFASVLNDTSIEKYFFTYLSKHGLKVKISSNMYQGGK